MLNISNGTNFIGGKVPPVDEASSDVKDGGIFGSLKT